tara:strand:- start:1839 stop:2027 length:189 start_codon:yes stop_codon:yes gene_type:complete
MSSPHPIVIMPSAVEQEEEEEEEGEIAAETSFIKNKVPAIHMKSVIRNNFVENNPQAYESHD